MRPDRPDHPTPFLGEPETEATPGAAPDAPAVTILPVPFERTTSYGQGTAGGPDAILRASAYLETWDEELRTDPSALGIQTLPEWVAPESTIGEALEDLKRHAAGIDVGDDGLVIALGGEHSITAPLFRATRDRTGLGRRLGVVQFDAHSDLRSEYEGTPHSHACVMRRLHEEGVPSLAVGIRSLSEPEARLIEADGIDVLWAHELAAGGPDRFEASLERLPEAVYLTFDVDFFDPAIVPATGTPEPGGGTWYPTLERLASLFRTKRVVGMDVVELAPREDSAASDFLVAKLVYKCIGYWAAFRNAAQ